ncbi:tetratricopeptide repeat protein, partial [bacterium]|nr:tetratricopeptide repeat protein [bacterium]
LTNEIENYTEAILVGEPTAENKNFYGDTRPVQLPNSRITANLSYAWWQDKPQWENKDWTIPHIAKTMRFEDYVHNKDVVLDAALNYTQTNFILDPGEHLRQLFIAGKFEEFKTTGFQLVHDPAYKYYDFEKEFADAGNRLISIGNADGGMYILELVSEFYPKSVGALYNLATSQEQLKQFDKARESYKKLIELEPHSILGQSAKKKLESLKEN